MILQNNKTKVKCFKCEKIINDKVVRLCLSDGCSSWLSSDKEDVIYMCDVCNQPNCIKCKQRHFPLDCGKNVSQTQFDEEALFHLKNQKRKNAEEVEKDNDLIPNFEGFDCTLCFEYIPPRQGVTLRACLHDICNTCLRDAFAGKEVRRKCPFDCKADLTDREIAAIQPIVSVRQTILDVSSGRYFTCKGVNCDHFWDVNFETATTNKCSKCQAVNCIPCKDVHIGRTCEQYKSTQQFKDEEAFKEMANKGVVCYCCKTILIQKGGCGALYCNICHKQTCHFTGKMVGEGGCECTASKPCHKDCKHGCIPETPTIN